MLWGAVFLMATSAIGPGFLTQTAVFTEQLGSLTIPDFFGFRVGSPAARVLAALVVLFSSVFYMTAVFKGVGNTLEVFLGIPYWSAILLVFVIVSLYTAAGGFLSVVRTDVVQGSMLVVAALVLFTGIVSAAGGPGSVTQVRECGLSLMHFAKATGTRLRIRFEPEAVQA